MHQVNKIKNQLSLLYFALLGLAVYIPFATFLIPIALLAQIFPKLMNIYYFIMLTGIKFYIKVSPLKFKLKDLGFLSQINQRKCLIISNHRSHLDMYLFLSQVFKVRAVANAYLLKVPIIGQVLWMSGHFIMKVGDIEAYKKAVKQIHVAFDRHDKVLFFPEMHRCEPGLKGMNKFRLTAFQLARECKVDIVPVVISGTDKIWPKGKMEADFSHPVSIKALAPIDPHSFADTASLVRHIHQLMENELEMMST